ncbi:MAG: amino acid adenylation domain-containing protein, partial [Anaerolineae bacterium]|nr:amino acid adenylation domain-containing protein [Anaerolineae bacterium]
DEDFFELGGDSLLATRIISRVRRVFKIDLPLQALFEARTVAGLAQAITTAETAAPPAHLQPRPQTEPAPLSTAQQRFWYLDQLNSGSPAFNMAEGYHLSGPIDVEALERSLNDLVQRHESLRTTFGLLDSKPVQYIAPAMTVSLPQIDLSHQDDQTQAVSLPQIFQAEASYTFKLAKGPLIRLLLVKLDSREHVLFIVMHHIISDGWSMGVFYRELSALYNWITAGQPLTIAEPTLQYADFASWQQSQLTTPALRQQLNYWQTKLKDAPRVLELPADYRRPAVKQFNGGQVQLHLSTELTEQLQTFSRRQGVTLYMTLLAAFKALLYRYTDQTDILVGTPIAGRNQVELENIIGIFFNNLVLYSQVRGEKPFTELLGQVQHVTAEAYAHQDLPFEYLLNALQLERDPSRNPLCQIYFNMLNLDDQGPTLAGIEARRFNAETVYALTDLTLYSELRQGRLNFKAAYSTDLFKPESISRLLAHYQTLLAGLVANPQCPIDDLPLLTSMERQQFLSNWQGPAVAFPQDQGIHHLIEAQVARTPTAPAVAFLNQELTYAELDERANRVANYLLERGVGPEVMVGLCVQRSLDMVVGILGVLKAGGAYVPLDPSYPPERIAYMIEDAGLKLILTQAELQPGLAGSADLVCLDRDWPEIGACSARPPAVAIQGDTLAYVIYTSGSTGRPKGVMITHRNLCHFVNAVRESLGISAADVYLQTGSITYALSVRQLMTPLSHGAKVIISSATEITNPVRLFELIKRQGVTRTDFVPSQWRAFLQVLARLDAQKRADLLDNRLHHIVSIGEPLLSDIPQTWWQTLNHPAQLTNIYGQTETTGVVAHYPIPIEPEGSEIQVVPIGQAVPNTHLFILDKRLQPVPVGVPGELFVASPGLARGYLNRPDLDAEKFLPHPFSRDPQARLYRTGDHARFRSDGAIEFMGRKDHQIKIRGMRVELGEIEAALRHHLPVKEAVVTTVGLAADEKQIVAYLVGEMAESLTSEELRGYLTETLPGHMIPTKFIFLEALPRTPNGKIDRTALPHLEEVLAAEETPAPEPLFYMPSWQRSIPPDLLPTYRPAPEAEQWLIFSDFLGVGAALAQCLEAQGQRVVMVGQGQSFAPKSQNYFELNPATAEEYHTLISQLVAENRFPRRILYLWTVTGTETSLSFEMAQNLSFYGPIYLAQALQSQPNRTHISMGLVTDGLQSVFGHEVISSEKALLLGPARVISQEMGNLSCRPIDIEVPLRFSHRTLAMVADQLVAELYVDTSQETVAYRGRHRWTQTLEPVQPERSLAARSATLLRPNGVYLITGGLGGIGLALASHLAQQVKARLVLTGRSVIPAREQWPEIVQHQSPLADKIRQLQALETSGAELLILQADVTAQDQMEHVVEQSLKHFGDLNGVIHAAGMRGVFGPILEKSVATAAPVLAPKVIGAGVLEQVLAKSDLDFVIYCASLAGVMGRFWQADYCAANAFLDALAQRSFGDETVVVSIDFDIWKDVEVPIRSKLPEAFQTLLDQSRLTGLSTDEGLAAFDLVFSRPLPQLVVTHQPLISPSARPESGGQNVRNSPELPKKEAAPSEPVTESETKLLKIWQELFHTDRVRIRDDFFELGGHSLLAIRMLAQIEQVFGVALAPTALFAGATIEKLAKKIAEGPASSGLTSLVPVQPEGSHPPFFCVHGATGDVLWFRELAKYLGPDQPFYGLQSVGLDGLHQPLDSVEAMAAHYLREIRTVQPQGPYYLGGYCFGGQIVYEMAQQLQAQGETVAVLALLSSQPYNTGFNVPHSHSEYCLGLVRSAPGWGERLAELNPDQLLKRAQRKARRYFKEHLPGNGTVSAEDLLDDADHLPDFQRRVVEQNMAALDRYTFRAYQGHIHVFQAKAPSLLTVDVPGHGWDRLAEAGITTIMVPGSHQSILREPQVATLAEKLRQVLAQSGHSKN